MRGPQPRRHFGNPQAAQSPERDIRASRPNGPILPIPNTPMRTGADNPFMRFGRWSRRVAPLGLGLALWAALPSLEWCPFSWQQCHEKLDLGSAAVGVAAACDLGEAAAHKLGNTDACDGCTATAHTASSTRESSPTRTASASSPKATPHRGVSARTVLPCDPEPDPTPLGDRSYCIHPPADGVAPRTVDVTTPLAPAPHAVATRAPVVPAPPARVVARTRRQAPSPAVALPHTPPQSRAPPVGVPSNLF